MDMRDLRSRIELIRKQPSSEIEKPGPSGNNRPEIGSLFEEKGWKKVACMVYEKVTVTKNILPEVISDILFQDFQFPATSGPLPEQADPIQIPSSRLCFYDTETTGLSAGAGNIVFLAGFGELFSDAREFRVTQLFLSDFPGEPAFLNRLKDFLGAEKIYVSYNGKSFDSNVLKSRFAINGLKADLGYQLDLLYPARRLWKNIIGSCSLSDIESRVLDKRRALDVPGFMVPDLYFDFIRSGKWLAVEGVIAHHLEDIVSLAELLVLMEQLFEEAGRIPEGKACNEYDFCDSLGLASLLIAKRPDSGVALLKNAFERGNHRAGIELSLYFKREDKWSEAVGIWTSLWTRSRSIFAGTELAKYYEHRIHDLRSALEITLGMMQLERFRIIHHLPELEKRRKRLENKIEGRLDNA